MPARPPTSNEIGLDHGGVLLRQRGEVALAGGFFRQLQTFLEALYERNESVDLSVHALRIVVSERRGGCFLLQLDPAALRVGRDELLKARES